MADALVIGEVADGAAGSATLECVAAARALGVKRVHALLPGPGAADAAPAVVASGADVVYAAADAEELDAQVNAAQAAAAQCGARYVIGAKTLAGRDVMPRLAFRLGAA